MDEGGGSFEAALDSVVLLCEVFELVRGASEPDAASASAGAVQGDDPTADEALARWLASHGRAAADALGEAERADAARRARAGGLLAAVAARGRAGSSGGDTTMGGGEVGGGAVSGVSVGGGGGGDGGMRLEVFVNLDLGSLAGGCAALLDEGAVITIDYGADAQTLLRSARRISGRRRRFEGGSGGGSGSGGPGSAPAAAAAAKAAAAKAGGARNGCAGLRVRSRLPAVDATGTPCSAHAMVFTRPGWSDLTTDVDFTALAREGEARGLTTVYFGPQTALEQPLPLSALVAPAPLAAAAAAPGGAAASGGAADHDDALDGSGISLRLTDCALACDVAAAAAEVSSPLAEVSSLADAAADAADARRGGGTDVLARQRSSTGDLLEASVRAVAAHAAGGCEAAREQARRGVLDAFYALGTFSMLVQVTPSLAAAVATTAEAPAASSDVQGEQRVGRPGWSLHAASLPLEYPLVGGDMRDGRDPAGGSGSGSGSGLDDYVDAAAVLDSGPASLTEFNQLAMLRALGRLVLQHALWVQRRQQLEQQQLLLQTPPPPQTQTPQLNEPTLAAALADALVPSVPCFRPHWRAMARAVLRLLPPPDAAAAHVNANAAAPAAGAAGAVGAVGAVGDAASLPPMYREALRVVEGDLRILSQS